MPAKLSGPRQFWATSRIRQSRASLLHGWLSSIILSRRKNQKWWTDWDMKPAPSACEADALPLHHVPRVDNMTYMGTLSEVRTAVARALLRLANFGGRLPISIQPVFVPHWLQRRRSSRDSSVGRASD